MTRIKEIVQEAKHREKEEGFTQIVRVTMGLYSAYGIGFLEGAEWADKTMLDKVCEWLKCNLPYSSKPLYQVIEDLRKAMEE